MMQLICNVIGKAVDLKKFVQPEIMSSHKQDNIHSCGVFTMHYCGAFQGSTTNCIFQCGDVFAFKRKMLADWVIDRDNARCNDILKVDELPVDELDWDYVNEV